MLINNIDTDKKFLCPEIGNNHEGDINLAKEMILLAEAGADAVKFQAFNTKYYVSEKDKKDLIC